GIKEQGIIESMSNLFNSRGDELRSKMKSVGMNQAEADVYEEELDKGKLVIVASNEATTNDAKPF
ncbi:general stress protein, partial [Bacillus thuringiensis]